MGLPSASHSDDAGNRGTPPVGGGGAAARPDVPARQIAVGQAGDKCVSCEAPLASDQRYCLNCGERRGRSRFGATANYVQPESAAETAPRVVSTQGDRRRMASGTALIAGIATLLLAMGVGVEIGRLGNANNSDNERAARASAPSVQVVTVGSGGGGGATTTSSAPSHPRSATKAQARSNQPRPTATKVVVTKKVAAKATQAASKVLGASAKKLAPPTVKRGGSCSSGAGCQSGKFTGNFFGP